MAIISPIGEFKPEEERISIRISLTKQVAVQLSTVGAKIYALLLVPAKDICRNTEHVDNHYLLKPIVTTIFTTKQSTSDESLSVW